MSDQTINLAIAGVVVLGLLSSQLAFFWLSLRHFSLEHERMKGIVESTLIHTKAKSATELADAVSAMGHNKEALRERSIMFDSDMAAYEKSKAEKEPDSNPVRFKDLQTGHELEVIDGL